MSRMPAKKRVPTKGCDVSSITMDNLIEVFEGALARSHMREADAKHVDPVLPRVPYKVEQIEPRSPNEIACFRRYYKSPSLIEVKLTLVRPDFSGKEGAKAKKSSCIK